MGWSMCRAGGTIEVTGQTDDERASSYQWLLRALGTYLDEEPSCRITVAEVPGGFMVRLQRALHKPEPEVLKFDRDTLRQHLEQIQQRRKPSGPKHHQGVWAAFPNGHADFFRALGYELDQERAHSVLIDELEDGVVVSYSIPDGEGWRKKMVTLSVEHIEQILNEAFNRRKQGQEQSEKAP